MTFTTLVRLSFRTILLGSAAFGLTAALSLPPVAGIGGFGTTFAQSESGHGQGGAGGYRGGRGGSIAHGSGGNESSATEEHGGRGESGTHGSGEHEPGAGEDDHGSTHGGSSGAGGSPGGGGGGGTSVSRGHYGGAAGEAAGDESTSEEKKGPHYGGGASARKPEGGSTGGRPVWASEGIPEVELGRLNVARAPATVLNHAFSEVTSNWPATGPAVITLNDGQKLTVAELYSKSAAEFARIVRNNYDAIVRVDSPLENLSLLKDLVTHNRTVLTGVTPASTTDLAAIFLGSAADKTKPVTADTVSALYTILGLPALSAEQRATMATEADAVRSGINIGHNE